MRPEQPTPAKPSYLPFALSVLGASFVVTSGRLVAQGTPVLAACVQAAEETLVLALFAGCIQMIVQVVQRARVPIAPRQCPNCGQTLLPLVQVCPQCGRRVQPPPEAGQD